jgi:hypothetical protein
MWRASEQHTNKHSTAESRHGDGAFPLAILTLAKPSLCETRRLYRRRFVLAVVDKPAKDTLIDRV